MKRAILGKVASGLDNAFLLSENTVSFYFTGLVLLFVMFFTATEVISRLIFNYSFFGIVDIIELCVVILLFGSISGIQRDNAHLVMNLAPDLLQGKKAGFILQFTSRLIGFVVSIALFYVALVAFQHCYEKNMLTLILYWPSWPAMVFIPIGFLLLSIRLGIQMGQDLTKVFER